MALKKSELYSSLWASCDELRGGMDASQYKDYVLVLLFIKYVSDKYAGQPFRLAILDQVSPLQFYFSQHTVAGDTPTLKAAAPRWPPSLHRWPLATKSAELRSSFVTARIAEAKPRSLRCFNWSSRRGLHWVGGSLDGLEEWSGCVAIWWSGRGCFGRPLVDVRMKPQKK